MGQFKKEVLKPNETGVYFNTSKVFVQTKPTWAVNTN